MTLKCPECKEEMKLELQVTTTNIKTLEVNEKTKSWNTGRPVSQYEDDANPKYALQCSKCGHEFISTQMPFFSDAKFEEIEEKILKGTLTQEELQKVYGETP